MKRALPVLAAAALAAAAFIPPAASAAPAAPVTVTAATVLVSRPDSGGNGNWALDTMFRRLTITPDGGSPGAWDFTAVVRDTGAFRTIRGAYTPDQGAPYAGDLIRGRVSGALEGEASYSFTASQLPQAALVPVFEAGAPGAGPQTTSLWYEQAFPAGTVFGGAGIGAWGWYYQGPSCGRRAPAQRWADTSADGGGQQAADGNITGRCRR